MIDEEIIKKDYVDQATAAQMLEVSRSRINVLCREGRFEGAIKAGWSWLIPKTSVINFKRLRRGVKPRKKQIDDRTIVNNAIKELAQWKEKENNDK